MTNKYKVGDIVLVTSYISNKNSSLIGMVGEIYGSYDGTNYPYKVYFPKILSHTYFLESELLLISKEGVGEDLDMIRTIYCE